MRLRVEKEEKTEKTENKKQNLSNMRLKIEKNNTD